MEYKVLFGIGKKFNKKLGTEDILVFDEVGFKVDHGKVQMSELSNNRWSSCMSFGRLLEKLDVVHKYVRLPRQISKSNSCLKSFFDYDEEGEILTISENGSHVAWYSSLNDTVAIRGVSVSELNNLIALIQSFRFPLEELITKS